MDNKLDTKKIMLGIVDKTTLSDDEKKLAEKLQNLADEVGLEENMYELFYLSSVKKRVTVPRMGRGGFIASVINWILARYYQILYKTFEPALTNQENFNRKLVLELLELKKKRYGKG